MVRGDGRGGSRALGELIDEYGEEIFFDLKEFWGLDLVAFIAGEVHSTPTLILAMLRELPEHSRFASALKADRPEIASSAKVTERDKVVMDSRMWTTDRRLMATAINAVYMNTIVTGQWPKDKAPKLPTVGPLEWQPEEIAKKKVTEEPPLQNNFDVLRKMGWTGG